MKRAVLYIVLVTIVGLVFYLTSVHQYTRMQRVEGTEFLIPKEYCNCVGSLEVLISYQSPESTSEFSSYTCNGIEWCEDPGE